MNHTDTIRPIILAGGTGKRLWPLSRAMYPKQFQRLSGTHTMLQDTVGRVSAARFSPPVVICNEEHRFIVGEQLAERGIVPAEIILEPEGRGTGPAILLAAHWMLDHDSHGTMLIMPSDHSMDEPDLLIDVVDRAIASAQPDTLAVFAIPATDAQGDYGYIQPDAKNQPIPDSGTPILEFIEKPCAKTAKKMLKNGAYWNSGIFLASAQACLDETSRYAPDVVACCGRALKQAEHDMDFLRVGTSPFADTPVISFERLVLEKTDKAIAFQLDAGWRDLHVWSSVYEHAQADEDGNVLDGDIITHNCTNMFIQSDQMLTTAIGLKNMAIVATDDAVLVTDIRQTENVGQTVDLIALSGSSKHLNHSTVYRPWGSLKSILATPEFQVNELVVNPGKSQSLQKHMHRAEHWVVVEGTAEVLCDDTKSLLQENQSIYIAPESLHQLANPGRIPLRIIEIQSGAYLGDDDILRFKNTDACHRLSNSH